MRARTCFALACAILLAGVVFVTLALGKGDTGDAGFTMVLVALILGSTMLVAGLIAWVGLSIRADETAPRSN